MRDSKNRYMYTYMYTSCMYTVTYSLCAYLLKLLCLAESEVSTKWGGEAKPTRRATNTHHQAGKVSEPLSVVYSVYMTRKGYIRTCTFVSTMYKIKNPFTCTLMSWDLDGQWVNLLWNFSCLILWGCKKMTTTPPPPSSTVEWNLLVFDHWYINFRNTVANSFNS